MSEKIKEAMDILSKAIKEDVDYAWSWHCNLAMAFYDAGCDRKLVNEGAARFMQLFFDVDTRKSPFWEISKV